MKSSFVLASLFAVSQASYGFDYHFLISPYQWSCLKRIGYDFAVLKAWESNGVFDSYSV